MRLFWNQKFRSGAAEDVMCLVMFWYVPALFARTAYISNSESLQSTLTKPYLRMNHKTRGSYCYVLLNGLSYAIYITTHPSAI
jgi:hypothetical protein